MICLNKNKPITLIINLNKTFAENEERKFNEIFCALALESSLANDPNYE